MNSGTWTQYGILIKRYIFDSDSQIYKVEHTHRPEKVFKLTALSSLEALKAVNMTAFDAFSDDKAIDKAIVSFQWCYVHFTYANYWCRPSFIPGCRQRSEYLRGCEGVNCIWNRYGNYTIFNIDDIVHRNVTPEQAYSMGLLPDTKSCGLRMRRECRGRFPRRCGLTIPTCITARALRTCRDACWDR